ERLGAGLIAARTGRFERLGAELTVGGECGSGSSTSLQRSAAVGMTKGKRPGQPERRRHTIRRRSGRLEPVERLLGVLDGADRGVVLALGLPGRVARLA